MDVVGFVGAVHPCLRCGACCAAYRVGFYWGETEGDHPLPAELTVQVGPFRAAMAGTERHPPRCVALEGEIGVAVRCAIHPRRPSPCREFAPSWEDGTPNPRCDEVRARIGLSPLTTADFSVLSGAA